jgi:hypothetical protein
LRSALEFLGVDDATMAELLDLAKTAVGHEHQLTPEQSRRLIGGDAKSLREDAKRMRAELGMPSLDDQPRDPAGRFARTGGVLDMNRAIRRAAGRV